MHIIINLLNKVKKLGVSHNYLKAIFFLLFLIFAGALLMTLFEREVNSQYATFEDALWWAMVTVTTVGYGDKSPVTTAGRILAGVVMIGGIGSFGYIAGSILEELIEKGRGRMSVKFTDHFVICSYNYKAERIIAEIKNELPGCKIVLVAEREENPLTEKEGISFIRGDSCREAILEKANIGKARTVIVLVDDKMDPQFADAHSVLTTLAVNDNNPGCKIIAESLNPENIHHLIHAGADEIVCVGDISSKLISRASLNEGMTKLFDELMSNNSGNELYSQLIPDFLINRSFEDAFTECRKRGAILIGILKDGALLANPGVDLILDQKTFLIYIAANRVL